MVDREGRSVAVCVVIVARACAFGTFIRAAEAAEGWSGMVVTVGSTLTRLPRVWASDAGNELIEFSLDLSNERTNDRGMSYECWGVFLVSSF